MAVFALGPVLAARRRAIIAVVAALAVALGIDLLNRQPRRALARRWLPVAAVLIVVVVAFLPAFGALYEQTAAKYLPPVTVGPEGAGGRRPRGRGGGDDAGPDCALRRIHPHRARQRTARRWAGPLREPHEPRGVQLVVREYGLAEINGLREQNPKFVTDTFWPQILGELGAVGLVSYAAFLAFIGWDLLKLARRREVPTIARILFLGALLVFTQGLVESSGERDVPLAAARLPAHGDARCCAGDGKRAPELPRDPVGAGGSVIDPMIRTTVFLPQDPLSQRIGGILTFVKGFIKFAPDDFETEVVGTTADERERPLRRWQEVQIEGRATPFLPLVADRSPHGRPDDSDRAAIHPRGRSTSSAHRPEPQDPSVPSSGRPPRLCQGQAPEAPGCPSQRGGHLRQQGGVALASSSRGLSPGRGPDPAVDGQSLCRQSRRRGVLPEAASIARVAARVHPNLG